MIVIICWKAICKVADHVGGLLDDSSLSPSYIALIKTHSIQPSTLSTLAHLFRTTTVHPTQMYIIRSPLSLYLSPYRSHADFMVVLNYSEEGLLSSESL